MGPKIVHMAYGQLLRRCSKESLQKRGQDVSRSCLRFGGLLDWLGIIYNLDQEPCAVVVCLPDVKLNQMNTGFKI